MKIIVDTNIIFSALLNPDNRIGKLIMNGEKNLEFFSCNFLKTELEKHHDKLIKLSKASSLGLLELKEIVTHNITFVDERLLPPKIITTNRRIFSIYRPKRYTIRCFDYLFGSKTMDRRFKIIPWLESKKL